jgi:hypothetical protein
MNASYHSVVRYCNCIDVMGPGNILKLLPVISTVYGKWASR